jgi:hypothetical protein
MHPAFPHHREPPVLGRIDGTVLECGNDFAAFFIWVAVGYPNAHNK